MTPADQMFHYGSATVPAAPHRPVDSCTLDPERMLEFMMFPIAVRAEHTEPFRGNHITPPYARRTGVEEKVRIPVFRPVVKYGKIGVFTHIEVYRVHDTHPHPASKWLQL